jgi:thermitase
MNKLVILVVLLSAVLVPLFTSINSSGQQPDSIDGSVSNAIELTEDYTSNQVEAAYNTSLTSATGFIPDDHYLALQWAIESIGVPALWSLTTGDPDIIVAVLDTGIDKDHEDLAGQVITEANFTTSASADDINGHGTHIAGIIAAKSNQIGIVGVAPDVKLINAKVAGDKGRCQVRELAEGIVWAVDMGANVINISIQIKESSPELKEAIDYAWNSGVVIVAAAGNNGGQSAVYPAAYENVIAVSATTENGGLAPLSNYGEWVDIAAPGYQIYSSLPDDEYGYETGTSFATGYISAIAALLMDITSDSNGNGRINDEIASLVKTGYTRASDSRINGGIIDAGFILTLTADLS